MELEEYCERYLMIWQEGLSRKEKVLRRREYESKYLAELRKKLSPISQADTVWLESAFRDEQKKTFALFIFMAMKFPLPKKLFRAMIRAAVYEIDPSNNQWFLIPCLKAYGARRVSEALLEYIEEGDDFEKAGAAHALYWTSPQLQFLGKPPRYSIEYATPESIQELKDYREVSEKKKRLLLEEFVNNPEVDVRRSIIPFLDLGNPMSYPEDIRPLVARAIDIARDLPDEYIRHRLSLQLTPSGPAGTPRTFMAVPERKKKPSAE